MDTWASINSGREALAHMLVIPTIPKGKVFRAFVGSGFNLNKMNAKWIKQLTAEMSLADIVAKTKSSARRAPCHPA